MAVVARPCWKDRLRSASTAEELRCALRSVPVPDGVVRYEALDETLHLPTASFPPEDFVQSIRDKQIQEPHLWTHECIFLCRELMSALKMTHTLREWLGCSGRAAC